MNPLRSRYIVFQGSSDLITRDTLLWRYMSFEKFCWLMETSQLWHTRLDQFDDPFEGCVTEQYANERAAETDPVKKIINQYEPWGRQLERYRMFATCWHASLHESDAQWRIYAASRGGVAVISSIGHLAKAVEIIPPGLSGALGPVEYIDLKTHNMRLPFATTILMGFGKSRAFEHDREVRGMIYMNPIMEGPTVTPDQETLEKLRLRMPPGIVAKVDLKELVHGIVLGPSAATYMKELVRIIAKRQGLDHLVRDSEMGGAPIF